jgi:hypothetical protein
MTHKTKQFARAGYRIHLDRLKDIKSDVSSIRTHKFKCEIPQEAEQELKNKFEAVADVVDSSEKGSLLWFLVQLYGLGFLFVSKEGKKNALLKKLYARDDEEIEISNEYSNHIKNQAAFLEFVTKSPRNVIENIQNDYLPQSIITSLGTIFEDNKKISSKNLAEYSTLKKAHDGLLQIVREKKRLNQSDIQEFFGIKIDEQNTGGTTFVIQEISPDELKENSEKEIDIYKAYFRYLSTAAQKTGFDIQSLAGVSENQNALSNLFNKSLKEFQKSIDDCKRLIGFANPEFFEKNPETLDLISKTVFQLASKVNPASQADFIANSWGEYRNLFGGRLQGWLSNFQNRLNLFEESLFDEGNHQKIFEQINQHCDWKNIFPESQKLNFEKLFTLREHLRDALKVIKGEKKSEFNQRDFGTLLDEYNQYLRDFREFLMKWNNEGVLQFFINKNGNKTELKKDQIEKLLEKSGKKSKKKSEEIEEEKSEEINKEIIGYWSKDFIPNELDRYPRFIGQSQKDPIEEINKAFSSLFPMASEALNLVRKIRETNQAKSDFAERWKSGKKDSTHGLFHKTLETIKNLASRYDGKQIAKSQSFKFLEQFVDLENSTDDQKQNWLACDLSRIKFFVSGYEYKNKNFLAVRIIDFSDFLIKFETHFKLQNISSETEIKNWLGFQDKNISWDTSERGEIFKIYLSLLLRDLDDKIKLPNLTEKFSYINQTTLASLIFEEDENLKSGELNIALLRRFFASSVGSEIRSKISLLSRKEFVKRNVIQITNGSQSLLQYVPIEWGNFEHLKVKKIPGKRQKFSAKKLKKLKEKSKKMFSEETLEILRSEEIDITKSNLEIAKTIWSDFNKQNPQAQKKLAQILAEIPHRWELVLKTKQQIQSLESREEGLFIEKSNDKNIFDFCTKKSDYLYSFPIQTSVYQKQFLDKFLWGDKDEVLTEKILGSTVILERIIETRSGTEKEFALYFAIPFQFLKEEQRPEKSDENKGKYRLSTIEKENILGIDLGEYGFGWAIFNPSIETFEEKGFLDIPLLKKMRDEAASWKDSQARGIFSRPTTYLAELREQAAGQIRNQIHHLAITHNAKPVYEDSVDGFESGGQRISKLYKTLKTSDVLAKSSNKADGSVRKHFWGSEYAPIGGVIGAAKTSQTCRHCGVCKTSEVQDTAERERIKKAQRQRNPEKPHRGADALFVCQNCDNKTDADEQAAQNIALKFYCKNFLATDEDKKNPEFQTDKGIFSSLKFFLEKSKSFKQ